MRLLLLLALLLTLPVLPAAAEHGGSHGGFGTARMHGFHHGQFFRFRGAPFAFSRSPYGYGGWGYFPDWDWGWDGDWAWNGGGAAPPPASAPNYLLPPRPRFATEERPSVETTSQGVTIIRGPGSHHVAP
jgi:hypothetical protein